jgi:hypothetical protein
VTICGSVPGSTHDLPLLIGSGVMEGLGGAAAMMDKGYVGVDEHYPDVPVVLPFEKPRGGELSETQKGHDRQVASHRIVVEHTMAQLNPVHGAAAGVLGRAEGEAWGSDPSGGEAGQPPAGRDAVEDLRRVNAGPRFWGRYTPETITLQPYWAQGHPEEAVRAVALASGVERRRDGCADGGGDGGLRGGTVRRWRETTGAADG